MRWFKTLTVWAMLALWLPAMNHCRLEALPGLLFLACCEHPDTAPHQDDDCDTDACGLVENSLYKAEDSHEDIAPPASSVASVLLADDSTAPSPNFLAETPGVASPELSVSWQFSRRMAALPRAPSPAS